MTLEQVTKFSWFIHSTFWLQKVLYQLSWHASDESPFVKISRDDI